MRQFGWAAVMTMAGLLASAPASAYELKHDAAGHPIRWGTAQVSFVIDPDVDARLAGASGAIASAVAAWSGVDGAPTLSTSVGPGGGTVAYDHQNTILFRRDFAPAGGALAVAVSTLDATTGELLDVDIVINARHSFGLLPTGTTNPSAQPCATDATSGGDDAEEGIVYDLQHVVAHEVGHALGLADVKDDDLDVMYAYTTAGSAANRAPASDDLAGIASLYADAPGKSGASGCGATVAGTPRAPSSTDWFLAPAAGALVVMTRRRRRSRASEGT